jgi:predicted glycoside hydrolase/deacetylase ChbG (UPF0249 family)
MRCARFGSNPLKNLIINADDFGWDEDSCETTIACMEAGTVTSATILTGFPATDMAIDYAKKNAHRFSFGLHFNIVDGSNPITRHAASLCGVPGQFRASGKQRVRALLGRLSASELELEFRAQVSALKDRGVQISHIDSHGHLHKFPSVIKAIRGEMGRNQITLSRRAQNLYGSGHKWPTKLINRLADSSFATAASTDYFLTIASYQDAWFDKLMRIVPDGTTELAVHPGRSEGWRASEAAPLQSSGFFGILKSNGITLTNFRELTSRLQ